MPEQGSGPLRHQRGDLMRWLDHYGVKRGDRSEALRVLEGLRGGIKVDDTSHLVAPAPVPVPCWYLDLGAPGAGLYAACEILISSRGGAYIINLTSWLTSDHFLVYPVGPLAIAGPAPASPGVTGMTGPGTAETIVNVGTVNALSATRIRFGSPGQVPDLWFPGGTRLIINGSNNAIARFSFAVQEVP